MTVASGSQALASDMLKSMNANGEMEMNASTELTTASGVIAPTQNFHRIDTQADAASDDLDTITLPSDAGDGYWFVGRAENDGRTVVVKHNTGNIMCNGNADLILDDSHDWFLAIYDSNLTKWMASGTTLADVPHLYRRQGGSATVWNTQGSTDYTPTSVRMQAGSRQVSLSAGGTYGEQNITFPVAFSDVPLVLTSIITDLSLLTGPYAAYALNLAAASSTLAVKRTSNADGAQSLLVSWLAIGPE